MKVIIGTTDHPVMRITSRCWAIYVEEDGCATRVFGPDTLDACLEARPAIASIVEGMQPCFTT
jgi:hypothetical protein